ncbi:unnamed protein product, partial [marine sediment metagenome]
MATNQEIIEQQRKAIQKAQQQAQQAAARTQFSKVQLLQKQQGLASRAQRQATARLRKQTSQKQLAQIAEAKKKFEADVTRYEAQQKTLKAQQAQQGRFQDILDRIARGRPIPPGTTPQEVARAEKILEPYASRSVGELDISKLQAQGYTPVYSQGGATQQQIDDLRRQGLDVFDPKVLKQLSAPQLTGM